MTQPTGFSAAARRHWLLCVFLLVGVALRILVTLGYWPALELYADSYNYLSVAHTLAPGTWHTSGYPWFLALLSPTGSLGVVTVAQHLIGIASGLLVYALALRLGARRWLAALAALPVLLDGYQLDIEQLILAETLTDFLLIAGLVVLLWRRDVGIWRGATVGLLLTASTLCRTAVGPVLAVAAVYLLVHRRWRALACYCAVVVAALGAYGGWYAGTYGHFGYGDFTGFWLYGRVAPFATCDYHLAPDLAALCPKRPVSKRTPNTEFFADAAESPINHKRYLGDKVKRNQLGERFAREVIEHQPGAYLDAVLSDTWHYFTPGRWMTEDVIDMKRWRFPAAHIRSNLDAYHIYYADRGFARRHIRPSPDRALIGPLRTYQSIFYTPGPLLLACLIAAALAALGLVRASALRRRARGAGLVLGATAVLVLLSPSIITGFSYRYGLPLLVLLPPAGVVALDIGLDHLGRRRDRRRSGAPDQVNDGAPRTRPAELGTGATTAPWTPA